MSITWKTLDVIEPEKGSYDWRLAQQVLTYDQAGDESTWLARNLDKTAQAAVTYRKSGHPWVSRQAALGHLKLTHHLTSGKVTAPELREVHRVASRSLKGADYEDEVLFSNQIMWAEDMLAKLGHTIPTPPQSAHPATPEAGKPPRRWGRRR